MPEGIKKIPDRESGIDAIFAELGNVFKNQLLQQREEEARQRALAQLEEQRSFELARDRQDREFQMTLAQNRDRALQAEKAKDRASRHRINADTLATEKEIAKIRASAQLGSAQQRQRDQALQKYRGMRETLKLQLEAAVDPLTQLRDPVMTEAINRKLNALFDAETKFLASKDSQFVPPDFSIAVDPRNQDAADFFGSAQGLLPPGGGAQGSTLSQEALNAITSGQVEPEPGLLDRATGAAGDAFDLIGKGLFSSDEEKAARRKALGEGFNRFFDSLQRPKRDE